MLNELLGVGLRIIAVPCAKSALRNHPAYGGSVKTLSTAGVRFLDPDAVSVRPNGGLLTFDWPTILRDLIRNA